jgi:hypothetical protein
MRKLALLFLPIFIAACGGDGFTGASESPNLDAGSDSTTEDRVSAEDSDVNSNDVNQEFPEDVVVTQDTSVPETDVPETNTPESDPPDVPASDSATECTPGELICEGKIPKFCNQSGEWESKTECQYLCTNGICTGECVPGTERCLEYDVEACDSTGTWQLTKTCPIKCVQNVCNGTWCCKDQTSGACNCKVYQVCNAATGEQLSCEQTYKCCYHVENGADRMCDCLSTQDYTGSCQFQVDGLVATGHVAYIVDSCPE